MSATKLSRRHKLLAFAPALVVIGITAAVASGISLVPGAGAASSTITIDGSVSAGMSVTPDTTAACAGSSTVSFGDFTTGAPVVSGSGCTVSFATNSTNGANVSIDDTDAAPFFCTGACTAASNLSVENVAANAVTHGTALSDDTFGVAVTGTAGTPAPAAGANFTIDGTPTAAEAIWGPVAAAPSNLCETTAVTSVTQSCSFAFGLDGQNSTNTPGAYGGTANVLATANP
jgi:hypothetical protein